MPVLFSCSRCLSPVARCPLLILVTYRHWDCFCYNLHLYRVEKNNLLFHEPMHAHLVGTIGDVRLSCFVPVVVSINYVNEHHSSAES